MTDRSHPPKIECYNLIKEMPEAKPNPFKMGDCIRLRDGSATNGTVTGIMGNQVLVAWDNIPGDPHWYHQDFVATQTTPAADRRHAAPPEARPQAKPNPFEIGDSVRLRDGTFTNGIVKGILANAVLVAWDNVPGDPQWYDQDFVLKERSSSQRSRGPRGSPAEGDIVDRACRLVANMDDAQRQRFIALMREFYK